jgi:4-hydroxy-tetrahydrodipicolinate synthase
MRDIKSAAELKGLWAALPTPWTDSGRLDIAAIKENVARYAAVPVDGVYITDSDGEFYALELDEFREFVSAFAAAMEPTDLGVQVGVTWTNTTGIVDRARVCLDHGISAMHICFPYWMPIRRDEMQVFWETLATEVPDARWIHYNTARGHLVLTGKDYQWLKSTYSDQFIGTKLCSANLVELADCMRGTRDNVAHFVTDFVAVPALALGARGCYSFWVNTLPHWTRQMTDAAMAGDFAEAMAMQRRFLDWETEHVAPIAARGYLHAPIGKARGELTGFLQDSGHVRAPYTPMPSELKQQMLRGFEVAWPEFAPAMVSPGTV